MVIGERLAAAYPVEQRGFVLATNKAGALAYLDRLKELIATMDEFAAFPEAEIGVVLYALLRERAANCPDRADFSHELQGIECLLRAAATVLDAEFAAPATKPL